MPDNGVIANEDEFGERARTVAGSLVPNAYVVFPT